MIGAELEEVPDELEQILDVPVDGVEGVV